METFEKNSIATNQKASMRSYNAMNRLEPVCCHNHSNVRVRCKLEDENWKRPTAVNWETTLDVYVRLLFHHPFGWTEGRPQRWITHSPPHKYAYTYTVTVPYVLKDWVKWHADWTRQLRQFRLSDCFSVHFALTVHLSFPNYWKFRSNNKEQKKKKQHRSQAISGWIYFRWANKNQDSYICHTNHLFAKLQTDRPSIIYQSAQSVANTWTTMVAHENDAKPSYTNAGFKTARNIESKSVAHHGKSQNQQLSPIFKS